jgi:hypothetical protein
MKNIKFSILAASLILAIGIGGCNSTDSTSSKSDDTTSTSYTSRDTVSMENVGRLYIATYNKPPNYAEVNDMMKYNTLEELAASMKPDPLIYPENQSPEEFVETLYKYVFGRKADDIGKKKWVDKLYNGSVKRVNMWLEFEKSATDTAEYKDKTTMDNKVEVSKYYADNKKAGDYNLNAVTFEDYTVTNAKAEIDQLLNASELFPNATVKLTTGDDLISPTSSDPASKSSEGYDVIHGSIFNGVESLQTVDIIDGGGGRDRLRATVIKGSRPTLKNIEEVQFRFAGDDEDAVIDLVNAQGIEKIYVDMSSIKGTVDNVGMHEDFRVSSTQHSVTFDHGNAQKLNLTVMAAGDLATNNDIDIEFKANHVGYLNMVVTNSNFSYVQDDNSVQTAVIDLVGDNAIDIDAGKDTLKSLTLKNTKGVKGQAGVDLTFDKDDDMFTALETLSADNTLGNIKVHIDNHSKATLTSVETSDGIDEVMLYDGGMYNQSGKDMLSNLQINVKGGDDTVIIFADKASRIPSTAIIDGGSGMNNLGLSSQVATSMEDNKQETCFDDFHILIIVNELDGTVDMENIDNMQNVVLFDKYKDNSAFKSLESNAYITFMKDIDDNDGDTTITFSGEKTVDNTTDIYNINFMNDEDETDFGNMVANHIETINFTEMTKNKQGRKKLVVTADSVTTINVSTTSMLDISENTISSVTTLTAGDGGVLADISGGDWSQKVTTGAGNDTIKLGNTDGEHANVVDVGLGDDTITGGDGSDHVILSSGNDIYYSSDGEDRITLGTGRDMYIARAATNSNSDTIDRILDFVSGEDIFNFSKVIKDDNDDGGNYVGEVDRYSAVNGSLIEDNDVAEAVLNTDDNTVYIDINDDGNFDSADMMIDLSANKVVKLQKSDFKFE